MELTKSLLRTTEVSIRKLREVGVETVEGFLSIFPHSFDDTSEVVTRFTDIDIRVRQTIEGKIEILTEERTRNGKILIKWVLSDPNGNFLECVWFGRRLITTQFHRGDTVVVTGNPKYEYGKLSLLSPDIELARDDRRTVRPMYSDLNYISGTWIREKMLLMKPYLNDQLFQPSLFNSDVPESIRQKRWFRTKRENIYSLHFPWTWAEWERAKWELWYEELFHFQYRWLLKKKKTQNSSLWLALITPIDVGLMKMLIDGLPFSLTDKQRIVLFQILKDMGKWFSMTRLLQGDVGTGKTIVALLSAIHIILTHRPWKRLQVALMVPTEILAEQHFRSSLWLLERYGITCDLLIGSLPKKSKEHVQNRIGSGETEVIFGTHAIIQESVRFQNLAFVIVDEQHRFGVEQRRLLEEYTSKNALKPHRLNMSATPIPRTLALTIFGDQDISVLNEYPQWRKSIITTVIKNHDREEIYEKIREEVRNGRQVYWISPLVSESATLDVRSATEMEQKLMEIFPEFHVGLIHGKMSGKDKDRTMQSFYNREIDILSSTSVVEVGVDNPNATVICIEWAERFGLSQLHQFRGRVGRGEHQSYCFLFTTDDHGTQRLRAMEETNDGFRLAEIDLDLRGPGEVYGVRQSWVPDFYFADLKNVDLVAEIREEIEEWLKEKW